MGLISKIFGKDLLIGLNRTGRYGLSKHITMQYPKEKWTPYPAFRGTIRHLTKETEEGETRLRCNACGLCARACPAECITIVGEGKGKDRVPKTFVIDFSRCLYCGLCVEACPQDALEMTSFYESAVYTRDEMVFDLDTMLQDYSKWERTFKK